jgi:hypothetical protein
VYPHPARDQDSLTAFAGLGAGVLKQYGAKLPFLCDIGNVLIVIGLWSETLILSCRRCPVSSNRSTPSM